MIRDVNAGLGCSAAITWERFKRMRARVRVRARVTEGCDARVSGANKTTHLHLHADGPEFDPPCLKKLPILVNLTRDFHFFFFFGKQEDDVIR